MYFSRYFAYDIIGLALQSGVKEKSFSQELALLKKYADNNTVSYDLIVDLVKKVVNFTGDRHFGLHLGEYFSLKATAVVDKIMQQSRTLQEAFANAVTYSRLISDSMDCGLVEDNNQLGVWFENNPEWALQPVIAIRHNLDTALVCTFKSIQSLTGFPYYPAEVRFPYSKPKYFNEYYRIFSCSLQFRCERAEILFSKRLFKKTIASQNSGLLAQLKKNAAQQLAELATNHQFSIEVKKGILKNIHGVKFPGIVVVAHALNMTERTLQRRLKKEGLTFNRILLDVKMQLAIHHLSDNHQQVEAVAYLLGYSEASAFIRAFKNWKGISPKAFIHNQQVM